MIQAIKAMRLMPMTLCHEGTKLSASRSEEPMTDDTPPQQIQEAN